MNHCTTPQTAFLLKESGFPQPTPEFGQAWANESIHRFIIDSKFGEGRYNVHFPVVTGSRVVSIDPCSYCPDATDILLGMSGWAICFDSGQEAWGVFAPASLAFETNTDMFFDKNPAEAAAMAWLAQNENKETEQ